VGNYASAIADYDQAIKNDPKNAAALTALALARIVGVPTQGYLKTRRSRGFEPAPRPEPALTQENAPAVPQLDWGRCGGPSPQPTRWPPYFEQLLIAATAAARTAADSHR
jgi:hypothetical protein